ERSIATYWFTVDRQSGVMASGRIAAGSAADSSWWLGLLQGNGTNTGGDGGRPMVVGRYQWNFTRSVLPFSQSAVRRYSEPTGSLALAFVTNDSPYTRFSSSGGGSLPGFETGEDNQYRLTQFLLEYAWQRQGWSIQGEAHYKAIDDRKSGDETELIGGYLQAGLFPAALGGNWPEPLEFAIRAGYVDPGKGQGDDNTELTAAANWFFNGHRNKLTADISWLTIDDATTLEAASDWRFRIQWDISL
ncbi:MAG: porin, partial [Xanthomonadales bacterium]|nr:porin [Xanthomonadales bacterium]